MRYNLFISHSWSHSNDYDDLIALLEKAKKEDNHFDYANYSVPKDDPIHNAENQTQLKNAIENQIRNASCVLILAGVYSSYSKWIDIEVEISKKLSKPIIAVEKYRAQRSSMNAKDSADKTVAWRVEAIKAAIKEFCK